MKKNVGQAIAGVALGIAAGTAAYAISSTAGTRKARRKLKKTADAAVKNVGAIIENVSNIVK